MGHNINNVGKFLKKKDFKVEFKVYFDFKHYNLFIML